MELLIFIPAREGSKGIPNKNISNFGDNKLIDFTLQTAKEIKIKKKYSSPLTLKQLLIIVEKVT